MELGNNKTNELINRKDKNKYYIEEYNIDSTCKNDSHYLIGSQVRKNSVVLDVGCAQGIIGNYLNKVRNCKVYGIEIDEEAIKFADSKKSYEKLYNFSVSDKTNANYKRFFKNNLKFDYIIFADLLEHLIDPADVIYEYQKLLKPTGKILISLPNIAHFDIIRALLNDDFNYSKIGLLDNTHLRFFTKNSFIDLVNQINSYYKINLNVKLIGTTIVIPEYINEYKNIYSILNKNLNVNVLQNIFELSFSTDFTNKKNSIDLCKCIEKEYSILLDEKKQILESKIVLDSEKTDILKKYAELEAINEGILKKYAELEVINKKINNDNEKLNGKLNLILANLKEKENILNGIYNSKTWKTIGKVKQILKKISFRRK